MTISERKEIYLFDHLAPALITFSVIKEEHAHIQPDIIIRSKNSISPEIFPAAPQLSGKTTGNEIVRETIHQNIGRSTVNGNRRSTKKDAPRNLHKHLEHLQGSKGTNTRFKTRV